MYNPGMKDTIYLILNKHMPYVFKCGITQYDGSHRAKTLSTTGVPGKMEVYREIRIFNAKKVEDVLKAMFKQYKVEDSEKKEWYYKTVLPQFEFIFDILELQQVTMSDNEWIIEKLSEGEEAVETIINERKRKEKLKFSMINLNIGDELEYVNDERIKVTIVDDNLVEYEQERYTLSALTAILDDKKNVAYQGPAWWCYNGKKLIDIRKEIEMTTNS